MNNLPGNKTNRIKAIVTNVSVTTKKVVIIKYEVFTWNLSTIFLFLFQKPVISKKMVSLEICLRFFNFRREKFAISKANQKFCLENPQKIAKQPPG